MTTPLRRFVRQWVPPALIRLGRRVLIHPPEWEFVPEGWQARGRMRGWDVESVVEAQKQRWPGFLEAVRGPAPLDLNHEDAHLRGSELQGLRSHNILTSFAYVAALAARQKQCLRMLDWGGGLGQYLVVAREVLPGVPIDYSCQDLSRMCVAGRSLLPEAHFFDRPDECLSRAYDLVLASSSLWYEEDWRALAGKLTQATADYLFVTRMFFVQRANSFVAVQRPRGSGYCTEYLCWILREREFVDYVESRGLKLVRTFFLSEGAYIVRAPEQPELRGFLFRRLPNSTASGASA